MGLILREIRLKIPQVVRRNSLGARKDKIEGFHSFCAINMNKL